MHQRVVWIKRHASCVYTLKCTSCNSGWGFLDLWDGRGIEVIQWAKAEWKTNPLDRFDPVFIRAFYDMSGLASSCVAFDNTCLRRILRIHVQPMQLLLKYDSELALHRSCCRSSKQDGSVSSGTWHGWAICKTRPEPYIRRCACYPRTGGAAQDVHVAPGYGPWKHTSSRSITVWTQPGDLLRTENDGGNLWKWLRSSHGHARDDDDEMAARQRCFIHSFPHACCLDPRLDGIDWNLCQVAHASITVYTLQCMWIVYCVHCAERYAGSGADEWSLSATWSRWERLLRPTICRHRKTTGLSSWLSITPDFAIYYSQTDSRNCYSDSVKMQLALTSQIC